MVLGTAPELPAEMTKIFGSVWPPQRETPENPGIDGA